MAAGRPGARVATVDDDSVRTLVAWNAAELRFVALVRVEFERDRLSRPIPQSMREVPDSEFELPADLVLLAMGFVHPVHSGLVDGLDARARVFGDQGPCDHFGQVGIRQQPGLGFRIVGAQMRPAPARRVRCA